MSKRGTKRKAVVAEKMQAPSLKSYSWEEICSTLGIGGSLVRFTPKIDAVIGEEEARNLLGWLKLHCISEEIDHMEFINDILNKCWVAPGSQLYFQNNGFLSSPTAEGTVDVLLSYVIVRFTKLPFCNIICSNESLSLEKRREEALSEAIISMKVMHQTHQKIASYFAEKLNDPDASLAFTAAADVAEKIRKFAPVYSILTDLSEWILLSYDGAFFKTANFRYNLSFVAKERQAEEEEEIRRETAELMDVMNLLTWLYNEALEKGGSIPSRQLSLVMADKGPVAFRTRKRLSNDIEMANVGESAMSSLFKSPAIRMRKMISKKKRKMEE